MSPQDLTLIAALAYHYGKRVEGGYLLHIPNSVIMKIKPNGTITPLPPDNNKPGVQLLYTPAEMTIDGKMEFIMEPDPEPAKPDYPVLETPPEVVVE
jgi:hypothetical protein